MAPTHGQSVRSPWDWRRIKVRRINVRRIKVRRVAMLLWVVVLRPTIGYYTSGGTPDQHVSVGATSGNHWGLCVDQSYATVLGIPCFPY